MLKPVRITTAMVILAVAAAIAATAAVAGPPKTKPAASQQYTVLFRLPLRLEIESLEKSFHFRAAYKFGAGDQEYGFVAWLTPQLPAKLRQQAYVMSVSPQNSWFVVSCRQPAAAVSCVQVAQTQLRIQPGIVYQRTFQGMASRFTGRQLNRLERHRDIFRILPDTSEWEVSLDPNAVTDVPSLRAKADQFGHQLGFTVGFVWLFPPNNLHSTPLPLFTAQLNHNQLGWLDRQPDVQALSPSGEGAGIN